MTNTYMVKLAWQNNHARFGKIISFVVSPKRNTYANVYGYDMSKKYDEVFCLPANSPQALSIISRLSGVGGSKWMPPTYGDIVEIEFDLDDFYEEYCYQDTYEREVAFHTHLSCF
jgi:hypothetical protein